MKLQEKSVYEYAENFQDIKSIINFTNEQYQKIDHSYKELFYNFSFYDIANGLMGNCLFLAEMYKVTGDMKYMLYAHQILKLGINRSGIESIDNPGLWTGLSGVCFTLETLNRNKEVYGDIIVVCDQLLKEMIQTKLDKANENLAKQNVMMKDYDLMEGFVGITQYILTYKMEDSEYRALLEKIADYFVELSKSRTTFDKCVPNWLIRANHQFLEEEKKKFVNGNFNQGVSHGICGVLIILSKLYKVLGNEEIKAGIRNLSEWFYTTRSSVNHYYMWEKKLSWEQLFQDEEIQCSENQLNLSWCYGDLMIVYALLDAAVILENKELLTFIDSCLSLYEKADIHNNLVSPSICHGYAGTILLIEKIRMLKGPKLLSALYQQLLNQLTDSYNPSYKFGYKDVEEYNGEILTMDKYCLLTGSTGIYLTLMFLEQHHSKTNWETLFLLD